MKIRKNLISILLFALIISLVGCDNVSKNIEVFDELFNNNNYTEAFVIYEENKDNDEFLKAVTVSVNDTIENIKDEFNNENYNLEEAKTNVENIKEFISDEIYNQTLKYLNDLDESKNNFYNAQEKEKLTDFDSALIYYEKVIESDINYSAAKENIDIINDKIAESYKQFVISMKDKVEVEIDDIEKLYSINFDLKSQRDIVYKEPYAGISSVGITGELAKEDSANFDIMMGQVVPRIVGNFTEVIFYQELSENVVFNESDMPVQVHTDPNWINMYGSSELACVFVNSIVSEINSNEEKFNMIYNMLNNDDKEIIIRMYFSELSVDFTLTSEEREKIKDIYKLYKSLKYDNSLINELI